MEVKHRQLARRISQFAKKPPKDVPAEIWQEIDDMLAWCVAEEDKLRRSAARNEDRVNIMNETVYDQLREVRDDADAVRVRGRKMEKALAEAVKIAKKDRAAGWKKETNPDFQFICECEDMLVERQVMEKEAEFQARIADQ